MRIFISVTSRQRTQNDPVYQALEVDPGMTVADLKAVIQGETNVPPPLQRLFHNGQQLLDDAKTLEQCQIQEQDMLEMLARNPQALNQEVLRQGQGRADSRSSRSSTAQSGSPQMDPEILRDQALKDPRVLAQIRSSHPELADAVSDPTRFREVLQEAHRRQVEAEAKRMEELARLNADPFDVDAQRKIEEMIRQERVMENLQEAMDHTPEAFGRVHMLYIPVVVNNHPIKAFVDSGAQATVMSPACAEACNIMRLIDKRFAGMARGVGTAKILGRVHSAEIIIGDLSMDCSFTVMEGKDVDLLLGLDMLKRHQAIIDLFKGALIIKNVEVKFLGEADIPKYEETLLDEPTVAGPAGMQTGARSGAVTMSSQPAQGSSNTRSSASVDPSSSRAQASASASPFPAEDIAKLMDMGFTREQAIQGLEAAGGNLDVAAGILL